MGVMFFGVFDYFVSEVLYFCDLEGNGVEVYCDCLCEEWLWIDDCWVLMDMFLLDFGVFVDDVVGDEVVFVGIDFGYVYFEVMNVFCLWDFYVDVFGMCVCDEGYFGVVFVVVGEYYYYVGLNSWNI